MPTHQCLCSNVHLIVDATSMPFLWEGLRVLVARGLSIHTVLPWIQPQSSCAGTRVYFNQRWPTILAMVRENTYDHAFTQSNKEKFSNLTSVSGHMATSIHRAWVGFSPLTEHRFQFFFCILTSSTLPNSHIHSYKQPKTRWAGKKDGWHRLKHTCLHKGSRRQVHAYTTTYILS